MNALLLAYFAPPLLSPESMLLRRLCEATAPMGVNWHVLTVSPCSSYGKKDRSFSFSLESLENPPEVSRTLSLELLQVPIQRFFLRNESFPDNRAGWLWSARKKVVSLIENNSFDVMISRAQPYTSHMLGLYAKRTFPELPWIAYFSDPWGDNPYSPSPSEKLLAAESNVLDLSQEIVVVSDLMKKSLVRRYPDKAEKISVIPHPYDNSWLGQSGSEESPLSWEEPLILTYAGNFYGKRSPEVLFSALERHINELEGKIKVRFVGKMPEPFISRGKKLSSVVEFLGVRDYAVTNSLLHDSDVLLLIDASLEESVFLPTKLVDYLALGKPILAVTPRDGAAWNALNGLTQATLFDNDEVEPLGIFLVDICMKKANLFCGAPPEDYLPSRVGMLWLRSMEKAMQSQS